MSSYYRKSPSKSPSQNHRSHNSLKSPNKYNSQQDDLTIRKCKNILSQADIDLLLNELSRKRTELVSSMQVYDLLRTNGIPQRCIAHNNAISLFCLSYKRLLCVNCVYGAHKHRQHKVCPLKDCMDDVDRDSESLGVEMEKEFMHIAKQEEVAEYNIFVLENSLKEMLDRLDVEFDYISKQLTNRYLDLKKGLMESYHELIAKHRKVLYYFSWLHSTTKSTLNHIKTPVQSQYEDVRRYWLKQRFTYSSGLRVKPFRREELENASKDMYRQIRKIRYFVYKQSGQ